MASSNVTGFVADFASGELEETEDATISGMAAGLGEVLVVVT